jgi:hypothetical protein
MEGMTHAKAQRREGGWVLKWTLILRARLCLAAGIAKLSDLIP